ncbi:ABC transporter ATP-binding protein [Arachnia propionica]|uniref:ABC transporter ATP-binding protein n=1 Tax=Arachnia propionica TaxID=1750 RepID=UPI0028EE699F|nr:ABC transporter ATP-binding protein [Arachnia propionica]
MVATVPRQTPTSVWELIRSAHTAMFLGGVVAFIGAALKIVPYIALVEIGRGFLNGASAAHHWGWFTAAVVSMVIHGIAYTGALGATHIAEANLRNELRLKLVNKLPRVPLGWVNDRSSGQINRAVIGDTEQIHTLVAHLAGDMMNSAGTVVAGFGYLLWLDARFAGLLILAWLLLLGMSTLPATKGMKQSFDEYSAAQRELSAVTVEMVDGIKEVKNFGMTADVFGRFDAAARNHADVTMNWMRRSGVSMAIMAAVMQPAAMLALTIGLGFWFFHLGWVTPITVVAFALVWVGIPEGLTGLVQIFQHIYAAKQAVNSTLEILGTPELATPTTRAALTADPSLIEVDDITFGYEPDNPVVKGVTLTCRPGTVTALVGPSGGGKSTLAKLIARFWDVDSGAIRIGGADVREQTDEQLMGSMALVFQDAMIASDTIANNIALGKPEAAREQVVEAARKAHVHDRITALPNGYDTMLGTGDGFLSGGEEQRLGIARAFLSAPRILILDEATAQADAHSELEIQRAISGLAEGRTVVMIAHRLSTIRTADQIAVIDEGRITECGSHDELISRDGHYARLWAAQQNTMTGGRDA